VIGIALRYRSGSDFSQHNPLEEQLGLKLEPSVTRQEILVAESAETPTL
jgi:hypothetical protein